MSIEAALAANTAALEKLTAAIQSRSNQASEVEPAEPAPKRGRPSKAASDPAAPANVPTNVPTNVPSYKDVADVLVPLAESKGRDTLVGLLGEFGVKSADQIKPEQYSAIMSRAREIMSAPAPTGAAGLI